MDQYYKGSALGRCSSNPGWHLKEVPGVAGYVWNILPAVEFS
ncbi:hypothetical protein [Coleofasciculus sp.]